MVKFSLRKTANPHHEEGTTNGWFGKETRSTNFTSSDVISYKSIVKPYRIREQPFSFAHSEIYL